MVGSHDTAAAARLTVGVIGLGLIGGSLARRLAVRGVSVVAWNHRPHPYAQAEADGIRCMRTLAELVEAQPEVIVLCNPLKAMPAILGELRPLLEPYQDITLTDVGSVKMMVRDQVRDAGLAGRYVGAHPMAGNELSGWAAAAPSLYDNALWAMTVDGDTDYRRFLAVARMITDDVGNRVIVLDDDTHDRAAALISHMPHVVATALINQLTDAQVKVVENDTLKGGITFEVAPWVRYEIRDSVFVAKGEGWELTPGSGIAFEGDTRHLVYNTSDIPVGVRGLIEVSPRLIKSPRWKDSRLVPGTVIAMRSWERPAPGVFLYHDVNTTLENIKVHYAEGMGLLAQVSENITLDGFSVCLKGADDPRYFTTQADATHFSACKGAIISKNGLYEGMMDDAINVHGTYLKVVRRVNDSTLVGRYMHPQSYGFEWGRVGDSVQFIHSSTMELIGARNRITAIKAVDQPDYRGAKEFEIRFENTVNPSIHEGSGFGIENLEWTPTVLFSDNVIRNNRARGSLFSTPRQTVVENNVFDHTSGTAILLCGDCNGWFETGACRNVLIRKNKFINSLTNMFQFTNAIISIYPEIPDLASQRKYFHSDIVIDANEFITFDRPLVYAKSVDGLVFTNNIVKQNKEYPAFHWNNHRFYFQRVIHSKIENNYFDEGFIREREVLEENNGYDI